MPGRSPRPASRQPRPRRATREPRALSHAREARTASHPGVTMGGVSPEPIRVVIADDHAVVRRGLSQVLEADGGFELVAEAPDLDTARRYVRGHHPDVLVLDLNMPG